MAKKTNPNAGKPGYDKYGVKLVSQRRKEEQAKKIEKNLLKAEMLEIKKLKMMLLKKLK